MKLLSKAYLLAAGVMVSATLAAPGAMAGDDPVGLANKICAGGDINAIVMGATPEDGAVALGEAARQLKAGQCPGSNQNAINAALAALIAANPTNTRLQTAYNEQAGTGQQAKGDGIDGLAQDEDESVSDTLVSAAAGEAISED